MSLRYLLCALLLLTALPAFGQSDGGEADNYGRTPDELVPYRDFKASARPYFADRQSFLGSGRDKAPPAGLKSVRIGILAPIEGSSPEAIIGRRMLQGVQLAVEEANALGGYRGLPYELVVRNDIGPWGSSSNKFVELVDEDVWVVLGSVDGQNTHIALRVALKLEIPVVSTASTDPTLTETRIPWYVRVNADDRQNSYALASYIFLQEGVQRVAMLRANSRYARVGVGEFRDAARRLKRPILLEMRYAPGDQDFRAQLQRIQESGAEAVVLWGDAEEMARIIRQMRQLGMKQPVFGPDRMLMPEFLAAAGPAADGTVAVDLWYPHRTDAALAGFYARYRQRFGEEAEATAAHAYDGMNLIVDAIEEAGLNRTRIRDWLTAQHQYRGVTGEIPLDATWNDVGPVYLARLQGGRFEYFATSRNGKLTPLKDARHSHE